MYATTINAFPPLHAFNTSRSWFLAAIVLLHLGFFWVLNNGLSIGGITVIKPGQMVIIPTPPGPTPPAQPTQEIKPLVRGNYVPQVGVPTLEFDEPHIGLGPVEPIGDPISQGSPGSAEPELVEPTVNTRIGLSQPVYPSSEIRMGHEGTVVLAIEVLENGRIGAVKIEQSSGYERLDESAVREARRWRMSPGTKDGVPTRMWKRVPITFRLQDAR